MDVVHQQERSVTRMTNIKTEILSTEPSDINSAAAFLRQGALVSFPTETVYGLAADATDSHAVAQIFETKGRPQFNPLIVHVATIDAARAIGDFDDDALGLAQAFWPGPLTIVVPLKPESGICELVTAGLTTVAIRVPAHKVAQDLLAAFAGPLAAPSANPSGKISPTRVEHVVDGLSGKIAAIVDGGPCPVGLESTIVSTRPLALLRPGGLPLEAIQACLGKTLTLATSDNSAPTSPGQLRSHYAPDAKLRLNATELHENEVMLGFGDVECTLNLSASGDLVQAAANLFSHLRTLDQLAPDGIAVSPIPNHGLGRAINDRLQRAAAPRDS